MELDQLSTNPSNQMDSPASPDPAQFRIRRGQNDLVNQGYPICSVHRLHGRDGRPLSLVLAVLNKTESAKEMCKTSPNPHEIRPTSDDRPRDKKITTNWKRCRSRLRKSTPALNKIPNDIESTNDIDNAIGTLTSHITKVVPRESLQRKVRERVRKSAITNGVPLWKELPYPQSLLASGQSFKSDGYEPVPALKNPDNTLAFEDREKLSVSPTALKDNAHTLPHDPLHTSRIEEEVRQKVSPIRKTIWTQSR
ncbi:hypothetical protein EVAR_78197_1 [Eumeta japonica]|uniref:Uncharacterized protein n=1 Tax=Eumeta variegata TaxID=151549 RepID=A0A4C1V024_EUMVA|nr:hypothetical protein EVAR_78197_1 [Eumeta japonica]